MNDYPDKLYFMQLDDRATLPRRATDGAAGWDLYSIGEVTLWPGERALFHTGVAAAIPKGWCGQVWPRSGLSLEEGMDRLAGLIDPDYRGGIGVVLVNHGEEPVQLPQGTRVAQLVVVPCLTEAEVVDSLPDTARGGAGYGSTGRT